MHEPTTNQLLNKTKLVDSEPTLNPEKMAKEIVDFFNPEVKTLAYQRFVELKIQQAITTTIERIEEAWDKDGMEELSYKTFSTLKQELLSNKGK